MNTVKRFSINGLNELEYSAFKQAVKNEIPFTVNIRICKRQYAYGAIDIRPKNPRGNNDVWYKWTEAEFITVMDFLTKYGMVYSSVGSSIHDIEPKNGFDKFAMQYIVWNKGFNFMMKDSTFNQNFDLTQTVKSVKTKNEMELNAESILDCGTTLMTNESHNLIRPVTAEEKQSIKLNYVI